MSSNQSSKKSLIHDIKEFLLTLAPYLLFLLVLLIALGYKDSFLFLNRNHKDWLDVPMFIITHIGDSLILSSLIVLFFVRKHPEVVITTLIIIIITGIIGQLLKISMFSDWDRPLKIFNEEPIVYVLPNYKLFHNSFPSGHSITISAGLSALIIGLKAGRLFQMVSALIIILTSFSRIYLGVHFPGDVLAGCIIGICSVFIFTPYFLKIFSRIRFSGTFKKVITIISICTLLLGIWFLKDYLP